MTGITRSGASPARTCFRTTFKDDEWDAFKDASPIGTNVIKVRIKETHDETKLFRDGDYVKWIAQYRWRLIAVFTFRSGLGMKSGCRLFIKWIRAVELAEVHLLSWLAMPERGKSGNLHLHVLIAGIHSRVYRHVRMWNYIAGHCHLLTFDPHHRGRNGIFSADEPCGIDCAIKSWRCDGYDFDGSLHDQHLLPRFRKLAKIKRLKRNSVGELFSDRWLMNAVRDERFCLSASFPGWRAIKGCQ